MVRLAVLLRMTRFARVSSRCKGDAVLFSYILIYPSAPSGTLTVLRLASSFCSYCFMNCLYCYSRRVTGGVYAPQSLFQKNSLFSFYC